MAEVTRIEIDGRWSLDDFATFSGKYTQAYSFLYSISPEVADREDFVRLYTRYPWAGGYSVVNFFHQLYARVPPQDRPEILQIQYASPGFVELTQIAGVAATLGTLVLVAARSAERISAAYLRIQKDLSQKRLAQIDLRRAQMELESKEMAQLKEQMEFIKKSYRWFASELEVPEELIELLNKRADGDTLAQLKMLLSLYRRIKPIAELQRDKKLDVSGLAKGSKGKVR